MFSAAGFWWCLTMTCIVWFSTITIYVAIRGAADIRHMLTRLRALQSESEDSAD